MAKFKLGRIASTIAVYNLTRKSAEFKQFVMDSLEKYSKCDWGDTPTEDAEMNDEAVASGEDRILAVYTPAFKPEDRIWIITESDHSATTILFPSEY